MLGTVVDVFRRRSVIISFFRSLTLIVPEQIKILHKRRKTYRITETGLRGALVVDESMLIRVGVELVR